MLLKRDAAAEVMEHLVNHANHGYDQKYRQGDGGWETITLSDNSKVTIATGDRDCSSAIISAFEAVGISCGGATYTGNMSSCMTKTGNFKRQSAGFNAKRGDVYLNDTNHTAMCIGNGKLAQFSINEKGGIIGGKVGDQTGGEAAIKAYYSYPWNCVLECVNSQYMPTQAPSLIGYTYHGGYNQQWRFQGAKDGKTTLVNRKSGRAIDIKDNNPQKGMSLWTWEKNNTAAQNWIYKDTISGIQSGIKLLSETKQNQAISLASAQYKDGVQAILWDYYAGDEQLFVPVVAETKKGISYYILYSYGALKHGVPICLDESQG
jgi:hypothetical protein